MAHNVTLRLVRILNITISILQYKYPVRFVEVYGFTGGQRSYHHFGLDERSVGALERDPVNRLPAMLLRRQ